MRNANELSANGDPALEFLSQGGLADARLPGDEDDLSLATEGVLPGLVQRLQSAAAPDQGAWCRGAGYGRARRYGLSHPRDEPVPARRDGLDEKRVPCTVAERGAHAENVFLHGLWLDDRIGPHGFEQLIMRDQPAGMLDQILEDRKGLRCQQDARLLSGIATPPETLVHRIEPEGGERLHLAPAGPAPTRRPRMAMSLCNWCLPEPIMLRSPARGHESWPAEPLVSCGFVSEF